MNLISLLRSMGMSYTKIWKILKELALLDDEVWPTLNYLRLEVGLRNARRLFVPLKTNRLIREALKKWAAMWPTAPTRLGSIHRAAQTRTLQRGFERITVGGRSKEIRCYLEALPAPYQPEDADSDHPDILFMLTMNTA